MINMQTNYGDIEIELDMENTRKTAENFLRYAKEGFYEGTIFHRVIDNFMIQGGGLLENMERKETHEPVENEADKGGSNLRGTIAMARTSDPDSATSQICKTHPYSLLPTLTVSQALGMRLSSMALTWGRRRPTATRIGEPNF